MTTHPELERIALEYIEDLHSSGITDERTVVEAVQNYLALDDDETEEVMAIYTAGTCPKCKAKLKDIGGYLKCPKCGHRAPR